MDDWQPIGRTPNQVILYHAPSNALSVRAYREDNISITSIPGTPATQSRTASSANLPVLAARNTSNGIVLQRRSSAVVRRQSPVEVPPSGLCPYCYRPIPKEPSSGPSAHVSSLYADDSTDSIIRPQWEHSPDPSPSGLHHIKPYFQILEQSVDGSRASTPQQDPDDARRFTRDSTTPGQEKRSIEGYYSRFFIEEKRLGMGAEGTVYLCQHVLDGNYLGHYAIKKVAIGNSKPYLYKILQEVRLLEQLRHPNIIPYHHVWIEDARFSSFAPPIATLHVLMSYANAGNLDTYIASRHSTSPSLSLHPIDHSSSDDPSPEELKRRLRERRKSRTATATAGDALPRPEFGRGDGRAVMLLGIEEIASLFSDVVNGLHFLHSNGILHLDLKCSNVLLHSQEGDLIPRAMISDFGTSEEMLHRKRDRTGHTGTMEYMAPETIAPDEHGRWREWDTKADIWSLGLILHKLLFFKLPYGETENYDELAARIHGYQGFKASRETRKACEKRGVPVGLLTLLEELTDVVPAKRPSIQKVVQKSTSLYTQASASVSESDQAVVGRRSLVKTLNPWWKEEGKVEQIQPLPQESSVEDTSGDVGALVSRYTPAALAVLKASRGHIDHFAMLTPLQLCSLLPPFRTDLPPMFALYTLIVLAILDLQARDVRVSWVANGCHLTGLWWLAKR